jgi:hypothetical protein
MASLFLLLIVASLIPILVPLFQPGTLADQYWRAAGAAAFSSCLQAIFVIFVGRNVLTLDSSLRFAIVGVPACILALVWTTRGHGAYRSKVAIGSSMGLVIWGILITLH